MHLFPKSSLKMRSTKTNEFTEIEEHKRLTRHPAQESNNGDPQDDDDGGL